MPWRRNRHHRPERPQSWRRNLMLSLSPAPQDYAHQSLWKGKVGQEGDSQFMVQDVFGIYDPLHVLITSSFEHCSNIFEVSNDFSQVPNGSQRCERLIPQRFRRASVSVRSSRRERLNSGYGCKLTLGMAHAMRQKSRRIIQ